ncbi:hypothetical protein BOTBODRAFT_283778 [Botryobasidium botryosum FD-172 SS1]|uniref:Lethal giant larvae (Lgl)-like C-terminal domain-containing protein n=1 Tax=Botryobasidium botryosum (strain FD-172 SS1) TaxID=930990 RepID=A0A067MLN2_BOTB1|nr:hypothetical protein BOTBODRAFT_283778 [Botryobasidium botryosum FD-172 SS1]
MAFLTGKASREDLPDFTSTLRDPASWKPGELRSLDLAGHVTAMAVEPVLGLMAIGSSTGSVNIYGSPASTIRFSLRNARPRFLAFAQAASKFLCIDTKNNLHVWDISDEPVLDGVLQVSGAVNSLVVSPSHFHAFLALQDGRIVTYDLDRLIPSPYIIPNLWVQHEEKVGSFRKRNTSSTPMASDLVVHPRDLNLLLIAYDYGVVLWDIAKRTAIRAYENCPSNENTQEMKDRRIVTSLAFHPSGTMFAVGHMDGSISFWATDANDWPLCMRTMSPEMPASQPRMPREPIFKLAWSGFPDMNECQSLLMGKDGNGADVYRLGGSTFDYANGETTLAVLGGLLPSDPSGVSIVQFPPFTPPIPLPAPTSNGITPELRETMRASLYATGVYLFPTQAAAEDFILLPRSSPHLGGAHDPVTIFISSEAGHESPQQGKQDSSRMVAAYEFPPPIVALLPDIGGSSHAVPHSGELDSISPWIPVSFSASSLNSSKIIPDPRTFRLPFELWAGPEKVLGATIVQLGKRPLARLIKWWIEQGFEAELSGRGAGSRVPLRGGTAFPDFESRNAPDQRLAKYSSHRILVTHHEDMTIRFHDMSPHLLLSSPMRFEYPQPLSHLTINLALLFANQILPSTIANGAPRVRSATVSQESLEVVVVLETGAVVVFGFFEEETSRGSGRKSMEDGAEATSQGNQELIGLIHSSRRTHDGFYPVCLLNPERGEVISIATSEIGFLAVAYEQGLLIVVDMRGPFIILREDQKSERRHSRTPDVVSHLKWTICNIDSEGDSALRLVASYQSGVTKVFTLKHSDTAPTGIKESRFVVAPNPAQISHSSMAHPLAAFVIDAHSGAECPASVAAFQKLMADDESIATGGLSRAHRAKVKDEEVECFLILASAKELRCHANMVGKRIAKVDWSRDGPIKHAAVVERSTWRALVAFTENREAIVYSLPTLERLHSFPLFPMANDKLGELSVDSEGDFVEVFPYPSTPSIVLQTLFNIRRPLPPHVNFAEPYLAAPAHPGPYNPGSNVLSSWIWGPKITSGTEIDGILAGPNRPPPRAVVEAEQKKAAEPARRATAADNDGQDVYSRLQNALSERGEMLENLEEKFASLESASKDMVAQAKRVAAQSAAKGWFF